MRSFYISETTLLHIGFCFLPEISSVSKGKTIMPSSQNLSIYGTVAVVEGIISSILKKLKRKRNQRQLV